ncbi:MAG: hypothetical protein HY547_10440 [Elusimicrobia bacterium]|nr:hypothetical protein [Elusimicrobiota bacterium]
MRGSSRRLIYFLVFPALLVVAFGAVLARRGPVDFIFIVDEAIKFEEREAMDRDLLRLGMLEGRNARIDMVLGAQRCLKSGRLESAVDVFCLNQERDFHYWSQRPNGLLARYLRAFRERGFRRAVFWIDATEPWMIQCERFASLLAELRDRGFVWGKVKPREIRIEARHFIWGRRLLVFVFAIITPCWLWLLRRQDVTGPLESFAIVLLLGSLAWLALQSDIFVYQIESSGIVRAAFLLPWIWHLAGSRKKWDWPDLLAGFLLGAFLLRLDRAAPVFEMEHALRDWLEVIIGIRPRLKEIAGWMFWMIIFQDSRRHLTRWEAVALLGPVSTVNSFLHAHTPWPLVAARSFLSFATAGMLAAFSNRLIGSRSHQFKKMIFWRSLPVASP